MTKRGFNEQNQLPNDCGEKLRFGIVDPSQCALEKGCSPVDKETCFENKLCVGAAVLAVVSPDSEQNIREIKG